MMIIRKIIWCSSSLTSKMQRINNPMLLGAFAGGLLTTLVYVVFSSTLSLTWNAQRSAEVVEDFARRDAPSPISSLRTENNDFSVDRDRDPLNQYAATGGERSSEKQLLRRKMLLQVIATSQNNVMDALNKVNTSWGQDTREWMMALSTKDADKLSVSQHVFVTPKCQDYPQGAYMTPVQLFCLLEAIYESFYLEYQWFFIATEPIYVSVYQLERVLTNLDPDGQLIYMGKPHAKKGYCIGESGIVLSHAALREIVPHLQACLEVNSSRPFMPSSSAEDSSTGDVALGRCFGMKLKGTCYEMLNHFVDDYAEVSSLFSAKEWMKLNQDFVAVYPAKNTFDMQLLYVLDQLRELDYQEKRARSYSDKLYNSSLCHLQPVDVDLGPPQNSSELLGWSVVNPNSTYSSDRLEPREWYDGELRLELDILARQGLNRLNEIEKLASTNFTNHKFRRITYGFFRYLGGQGRELILDVETSTKALKRLHITRPFLPKPILLEDAGLESIGKTIDFVVPLSNVNNRFAEFMKTYEDLCLRVNEKCRLNLVVYGTDDLDIIKSNITVYKNKYPNAQLNIIAGEGKFSRGRALHTGISTLQKSDLAFTCDVDMTIDRSFLNRCRRNTIQGRRVYYPEVFKYYDMSYVYRFEDKPTHGYDISRKHGHWCTYGYGMLCIYKSDYDSVNGYDTTIEGWGGEDIQLADDVINGGYEILRAPDPGLSHRYHPKVCSKKLSRSQYSQCLSSRNEDIADRRRLADYIYYLENKCNVKKKIWD